MFCENCENEHSGSYGSGRFCSSGCARSFSTKEKRKEINKKVSNTLSEGKKKYCLDCDKQLSYNNKSGYCMDCNPNPKRKNEKERSKARSKKISDFRRNRRKYLVEYKGGECEICGYNKCPQALEFHHLNESDKEFSLSADGIPRSIERQLKEIEKCMLVCANCHREIHNGYITLPGS